MKLDLLNNLLNNVKENNIAQNFIKELSNNLEKSNSELSNGKNNEINCSSLKQENCLYQVVEIDSDGAYLQNINNNHVSKETDISKDVLNQIENDSVLKFKDGKYIYEEELTRKIF